MIRRKGDITMAKEKTQQKKKHTGVIAAVILILAIAAVVGYFLFFHNGGVFTDKTKKSDSISTEAETQKPTVLEITPCDKEDEDMMSKSLVGKWYSYTEQGVPFTYTFDKNGTALYQKEGKKPVEFTYTFKDGLLTLVNPKKTYVYQCSKDAVGMMARMQNGQWQYNFNELAKKIPHFSGCVYILDDIMYLGDECLCGSDTIHQSSGESLVGEWVGVVGDVVTFDADGSYNYVNHTSEFKGTYDVDFDKQTLAITINGKTNDHDKDQWGLDGRVLRVGKQYYFRASV